MGILSGNPKEEPLHYGEVFDIWASLLAGNSMTAGYQTMLNHAGDGDLKKLLVEAIETCQEEKKQLEEILKENGVATPSAAPEPPEACLEDIPVGARIPDPAIAATLSADIAAGLVTCSQKLVNPSEKTLRPCMVNFILKRQLLERKSFA
ncbi:Protein of uncharacterised function (DUF3231) [Mycobacteroides abscessus subsp. abscessus]|nr:Protein of uncharacterised function (DUF3231) [Mycobacteroides abscessus subsp. abscessus]HEO8418823.1 DUF3231 family protein [Yersinia enterocolitica]